MKSFLILFSIFIVGSVCQTPEHKANDELQMAIYTFWSRLPPPVLRMMKDFFKFSGNNLDQKCPHSNDNFKEALRLTGECVATTDSSLSVCTSIKTRLFTCFEPAINITENCMPEKLKGVPTFIAKSSVSLTSYLCGITGEHMFEYFNDCLYLPTNKKDRQTLREQIEDRINKINEDYSVKNICNVGAEIKNLIKDYIVISCLNPMTLNVYADTIDALLKPCTEISQA